MPALTKDTMKQFRSDFEQLSKQFETKYGLKLSIGNIRFDSTSFRTTMSGLVADATPKQLTVTHAPSPMSELDNYIALAAQRSNVSLQLGDKGFVGSRYRLPGKRSVYTVTGINPRAPKYCVLVKTDSGAQYKMPVTGLAGAVLVGHE